MSDIYKLHEAAFSRVSAYIIADDNGHRIATVAIKYPADGAGRLWAYCHVIGHEMVRAHANGYGYDKRSAAVSAAFAKVQPSRGIPLEEIPEGNRVGYAAMNKVSSEEADRWRTIAPTLDRGETWDRVLEKAGYRVLQAV